MRASEIIRQTLSYALEPARARRVAAYNAGNCPRQLWYGEHDVEPSDPEDSWGVVRRFLGEQLEQLLVYTLEAGGLALPGESLDAPEPFPPGRKLYTDLRLILDDGFIAELSLPSHKRCWDAPPVSVIAKDQDTLDALKAQDLPLVIPADVKCVQQFSYERALRGDVSQYAAQVEVYMRACASQFGCVVLVHRDSSRIAFVFIRANDEVWKSVQGNVLAALGEQIPSRPWAKPERFPCDYCQYKTLCWTGQQSREEK